MLHRVCSTVVPAILFSLPFPLMAAPDAVIPGAVAVLPGNSPVTVEGRVLGKATVDYKVSAHKGKLLAVSLIASSPGVHYKILPPGSTAPIFNSETSGNQFEDSTVQDGDYVLRVYLVERAVLRMEPTPFRLSVGLAALPG